MSIVLAYKCDKTGKLFANEKLYARHMDMLAKITAAKEAERAKQKAFDTKVRDFQKIATWEAKADWIVRNCRDIIDNMPKWLRYGRGGILASAEFTDICFAEGSTEYWKNGKSVVEKFPVYRALLSLRWKTDPDHQHAGFLEAIGLHVGGGGGSRKCFSYTVDLDLRYHQNILWEEIKSLSTKAKAVMRNSAEQRAADFELLRLNYERVQELGTALTRRKLRHPLVGCESDRDILARLFPEYEAVLQPERLLVGLGLAPNSDIQQMVGDHRLVQVAGSRMLMCRTLDDAVWLKMKGAVPGTTVIYENR